MVCMHVSLYVSMSVYSRYRGQVEPPAEVPSLEMIRRLDYYGNMIQLFAGNDYPPPKLPPNLAIPTDWVLRAKVLRHVT